MIEARSNAAGFDLERVRAAARRALVPLQPTNAQTTAPRNFFFSAKRLASSDALPPYYLVRFFADRPAGLSGQWPVRQGRLVGAD